MRHTIHVFLFLLYGISVFSQSEKSSENNLNLTIDKNEFWWGGLSSQGRNTPYDNTSEVRLDLYGDNMGNQSSSLLLSSKGRYVWSESPIKYTFDKGHIHISVREGVILSGKEGKTLRSAYDYASKNFFPPNGKIPAEIMFTKPQYNTWIELVYDQNEKDILKYAQALIDQGYPPGVLMIDDNWQENYGVWEFSPRRFQDPKGMIDTLHKMGFQVMLWVCPFVSPDSAEFRKLAKEGMLLLDKQKTQEILWANTKNKAAVMRWWNGASACYDLSNPKSQEYFKGKLDHLVNEYGVDGFKFDAGDARFYTHGEVSYKKGTPNDHTTYFAELGLHYPLNEYRASWKMAGLPLAQRLRDKKHSWGDLQKLIPDMMSQSLMGYAYTCPDMIGGGEYGSFRGLSVVDQELIVRSAQLHVFTPMMQFSLAPWRVLSEDKAALCLEAAKEHDKYGELFLKLAKEASVTGEPIVKPMALAFPKDGFEMIKNQFVLGSDLIVAPVLEKGAKTRKVVLPRGKWKADDGKIYRGGKTIEIKTPLSRIPHFKKI